MKILIRSVNTPVRIEYLPAVLLEIFNHNWEHCSMIALSMIFNATVLGGIYSERNCIRVSAQDCIKISTHYTFMHWLMHDSPRYLIKLSVFEYSIEAAGMIDVHIYYQELILEYFLFRHYTKKCFIYKCLQMKVMHNNHLRWTNRFHSRTTMTYMLL